MATPIPQNRAAFSLGEVAQATGGALAADPATRVTGVAIDSRAVVPGALFVAVVGEQVDGARYLSQAAQAGAVAALVHTGTPCPEGLARIEVTCTTRALGDLATFHRRRWGRCVVAITGSAGKTTTKELTAGAFSAMGAQVLKTHGNLNNQFGVPMMVLCLEDEHAVAVLEVGTSQAGEIRRLGEIVLPDVAAVLLAAAAHTQGLGSVDAVADEKASLWETLREGGTVVVNADDARLMARAPKDGRRLAFGLAEDADLCLEGVTLSVDGTALSLRLPGGRVLDTRLSLVGHAAALDACAALACLAAVYGDDAIEQGARGLAQVLPAPGRLCPRTGSQGARVLDDTYNANPASVMRSLETLVELSRHHDARSVAVLADMAELGDASAASHADVGRAAVRMGVDVLVACGPQMSHAAAAASRAAAGRLAPHPTRVLHVLESAACPPLVLGLVRSSDVVLVKGSRSMQMERVVQALSEEEGSRA